MQSQGLHLTVDYRSIDRRQEKSNEIQLSVIL